MGVDPHYMPEQYAYAEKFWFWGDCYVVAA